MSTDGPSSNCEPAKIILLNGSLVRRVCLGTFMISFSKQEYSKILNKKNLTSLPWCISCCLSAYFADLRCFHSHLGIFILILFLLVYFYFFIFIDFFNFRIFFFMTCDLYFSPAAMSKLKSLYDIHFPLSRTFLYRQCCLNSHCDPVFTLLGALLAFL